MAESNPRTPPPEATVTRPRSTGRLVLLALLAVGAVLGTWCLAVHLRFRRQMQVIAMVERLGGTVNCRSDAPEWIERLQPDRGFYFGSSPEPLGPNWVRRWLPAETVVNHLRVVEEVSLDNGPGMRILSDLSGERRDIESVEPTDQDLAQLAKFTQLERLDLRRTRISDSGLRHLRELREIKSLNIGFTQVSNESLAVVAGFEKLEYLGLVGTGVTDVGISRLVKLKDLKELDVRATKVTKSGLAPFLGRPGLNVTFTDPDSNDLGILFSY